MKEEYSSDIEQFVPGSPESRRCGRGTECKPEEQREESLRQITRVCIRLQVAVQTMAGFPGGASGKEPACQCRRHKPIEPANVGSIPGLGRSPGGRHGNSLQYSCLEKPIDRKAWWTIVHIVTKSQSGLNGLAHT